MFDALSALKDLVAAREKATEGEWQRYEDKCSLAGGSMVNAVRAAFPYKTASLTKNNYHGSDAGEFYHEDDLEFIASAANFTATHGTALVEEVERLRKANAEFSIIIKGCGEEIDELRAALKGDRT